MCARINISEQAVEKKCSDHIHGVTCSLSCNHEEHLRTGFSTKDFVAFNSVSFTDQVEDGIKMYIDLQDTMF